MDHSNLRGISKPIALIVDDEPLILMDTCDIVTEAGFHVVEAQTADEAFEILKQYSSLQLVITDVQMPGDLDGIGLACEIAERWPHIKIIVASGAVQPDEGVLPEAAVFLNKPISADLVNKLLAEFFGP